MEAIRLLCCERHKLQKMYEERRDESFEPPQECMRCLDGLRPKDSDSKECRIDDCHCFDDLMWFFSFLHEKIVQYG